MPLIFTHKAKKGRREVYCRIVAAELFKWLRDFKSVLSLTREILKGLGKLKD